MCDPKTPAAGKRLTTASGVIYYPNTPEGIEAAKTDAAATMGPGSGEESQPPTEESDPTDCEDYNDSMWDKNCSKYYKFAHMGIKPSPDRAQKVACAWKALCETVLDNVKTRFPDLYISSAYRPGSQGDHSRGMAADIQILGKDKVAKAKEIFKFIGASGMPYSQLLFEGNWVHISLGGKSNAASAIGIARDGKNFSSWHQRSGTGLPSDLRWS